MCACASVCVLLGVYNRCKWWGIKSLHCIRALHHMCSWEMDRSELESVLQENDEGTAIDPQHRTGLYKCEERVRSARSCHHSIVLSSS